MAEAGDDSLEDQYDRMFGYCVVPWRDLAVLSHSDCSAGHISFTFLLSPRAVRRHTPFAEEAGPTVSLVEVEGAKRPVPTRISGIRRATFCRYPRPPHSLDTASHRRTTDKRGARNVEDSVSPIRRSKHIRARRPVLPSVIISVINKQKPGETTELHETLFSRAAAADCNRQMAHTRCPAAGEIKIERQAAAIPAPARR